MSTKLLTESAIYVVEYMIKYILINETIENFNIVIDCSDLSMLNFPY